MIDETTTILVTNQGELDAALEAEPRDDVVIQIDASPGTYAPTPIVVLDTRGHVVEARGESHVIVCGTSRLTARDETLTEACDNSRVDATNRARAIWRDMSRGSCGVCARGEACDQATVVTRSFLPFFASDRAHVTGRGAARIVARGKASTVGKEQTVIEMCDDVDTVAQDQVVVYCEGGEVKAWGHATVYVDQHADRPYIEGTPTVVVHDLKGGTPVDGGAIVVPA